MKRRLIAATVALVVLSGCHSLHPADGFVKCDKRGGGFHRCVWVER